MQGIDFLIPVFNQGRSLLRLIDSIESQCFRNRIDFQIRIHLDGCTDDTALCLKEVTSKNVLVTSTKNRCGKLQALQLLMSERTQSRFDYTAFTDSDISLGDNSIAACFHKIKTGKSIVMPKIVPLRGDSHFFYRWATICSEAYHRVRCEDDKKGELWSLSGNFLMGETQEMGSALLRIPALIINEDAFLGHLFLREGKYPRYVPTSEVESPIANNLKGFISQKLRVRRGQSQLERLSIPACELRKRIKEKVRREIIQKKDYALFSLYALDEVLFLWSGLRKNISDRDLVWKRLES